MATGGQKKIGNSLVKVGDLTLENTNYDPDYRGIVACGDKIIVIDMNADQVRLHRLQDGKLLCTHGLKSKPRAICVINDMEIAVILDEGQIQIMAVESRDKMATITSTMNLQVQGGLDTYDGVVKFEENLVVCGVKQETIYWCVVSLNDRRVDAIHQVCKVSKYNNYDYDSHITTKENMIYISCRAGRDSPDTGVYGFDILNPSQPKYTYKHEDLWCPGPIAINQDGFIYVCNYSCIHQLTSQCQLVSIYRQGIPEDLTAIFWDHPHGHLYVTCLLSKDINIYKPEYTGVPIEILNMDDRSIQLFEEALKAGKENVYNIRVMVVGHLGVGKTTLIKRLLGEEVDISERHSTEGVDVHVNCCDVSLSTLKWTLRKKDSEQDYKLQRLVKVLNKNYQSKDKDADVSPPQRESNDSNPTVYISDCDNNSEELNPSSSQQDFVQNLSSTTSQQEESPSTVVQRNPASSESNTTMSISELGENNASGSHQMDSVREMLNLLQENPAKAIQEVDKYASLTMWDFAGQYAFYTTHQMFLTRRAIYLLVSDVSGHVSDFVEDDCYFDSEGIMKCRVHELVEVWLNSIHSCAPPDKENMNSTYSQTPPDKVVPPPVILVGTHVDKIPQRQSVIRAEEELKQPQMSQTGMVTSTIRSNPVLSREELRASTSQDPLQKSARLQRKRKATEQISHIVSKKGLSCSDPKLLCRVLNKSTQVASSSRLTLERNCQTVGLTFHGETPSNGNCFFEAVSSQLQRLNCTVQMDPQVLRRVLVAFLKANRVLQVSDGNVDLAGFIYNETYDEYCARMAQDGEWADHVVVVGMARMLQRDIVIVTSSPSSSLDDIITWIPGQPNFQGESILLGHIWESHYLSLQPVGPTDIKVKGQMQAVQKKRSNENKTKDRRHELGQRYLRKIRSYLKHKPTRFHLVDRNFAIDNTVVDRNLEALKKKIVEIASQQPYWGEEIPARWLPLEQDLMKLKDAGKKMISRSAVEDLNKEGTVQIENSEELDLFLRYLHETGMIIYFSIEVLRENIVLDPKWLIDALKSLINAQPIQPKHPADSNTQSVSPADSTLTQKLSEFKEKGILTLELVDAVWTKEKHPDLHANRDYILQLMEQLNIIAKPRSFNEIGEKVENYFLTPCMLRQESPREVIYAEQDPRMVNTSVLCCVFTGKFLPPPIFHRLLAACVAHWPVAKKTETSENLIFCGCCVFDLDLFHRLTLHFKNHVVFARITRMVVDEVKIPDAKLCSKVRRFITLNLDKITSYLGQNLQYELCVQNPPFHRVSKDSMTCFSPFQMWLADEGHNPDAPIKPEHMNHARLCVALVTVCGNALREVLHSHVPAPHTDIYQAILANQNNLTSRRQVRPGQWQNALLNQDQSQVVFPDPQGRYMAALEQFDISLLYTMIRNVSTVPAPLTGWARDPQSGDRSLGASVERIRSYRNHISGHSADGMVSQQDFENYWNKINLVIHDIETIISRQVCSRELDQQRIQVISIYEAC